ncbi:ankyrin repeat domain-containing protein [Actinosynnema sp. NPDC020468]|uniref:ankyrin repeat domain-containing protein n=1 Tax=Actinosynnema sp. NPDC020468 TaxID=3154488 RepID=UPI0033FFE35B
MSDAADEFYHQCESSNLDRLEQLYRPGFETMVNHKLDFEDAAGLRWFLDKGVDVDECHCLHHAVGRGRSTRVLTMLIEAGADVNRPWDRWDVGRRPLALAARCGHLAAYELLLRHGAQAELDPVDEAVLAVARGTSSVLPTAPPPLLGLPEGDDYGWILGQFAGLGRTDVVHTLLGAGLAVDTPGWSGFTPLHQAAMNGRADTVRLLMDHGADWEREAWEDGATPLDCVVWGFRNNRTDDGDYAASAEVLLSADAPFNHGDSELDEVLAAEPGHR